MTQIQFRRYRTLSLLLTATLLGACSAHSAGDHRVMGERAEVHGASVQTWARFDAEHQVSELGFTLPLAAVTGAPAGGHPHMTQLAFPKAAQDTTFFNHLSLDFMPAGHEPEGRYTTAHFDIHFHGLSKAAVAAIDCKDATQADPADVPQGWVPPVPPNAPASAFCVPQMGYHALPASEFAAPGVLHSGLFDKVMIAGYYGGRFTFVEPMVTRALLEQRASFTLPVPQPAGVGRETRFPTRFEARYDASAKTYAFVLSDFKSLK